MTADVLLNPTFPQDEFARYKQRTRAQLHAAAHDPGFLGAEMFAQVMYGNHPAGRISITHGEPREGDARQALVEFHQTRYVPDHAVLAIAGDISLAEARKLVEARLGALEEGRHAGAGTCHDPPPIRAQSKCQFVARPNSVQTNLLVGTQAIDRTDPDYDVVSGDEQGHRRRTDRPAVHQPARREGLHLRRLQRR